LSLSGRARGDYAKNTLYTGAAVAIGNAVQLAGGIVEFEVEVVRDGEFTREGKPKRYVLDLLVNGHLAVEVEGKGSASAGNEARDIYLNVHGISVYHVSNERVKTHLAEEVAIILALAHVKEVVARA